MNNTHSRLGVLKPGAAFFVGNSRSKMIVKKFSVCIKEWNNNNSFAALKTRFLWKRQ